MINMLGALNDGFLFTFWVKSRNLICMLDSDWTTQMRLRDFTQNVNSKLSFSAPNVSDFSEQIKTLNSFRRDVKPMSMLKAVVVISRSVISINKNSITIMFPTNNGDYDLIKSPLHWAL